MRWDIQSQRMGRFVFRIFVYDNLHTASLVTYTTYTTYTATYTTFLPYYQIVTRWCM